MLLIYDIFYKTVTDFNNLYFIGLILSTTSVITRIIEIGSHLAKISLYKQKNLEPSIFLKEVYIIGNTDLIRGVCPKAV